MLVDVRGVKVHFPIKRGVIFDKVIGHVYAVDGVDLQIRRGETYGLVGESGCGKSTLGKAILNLEPPTEGSVLFDGTDIATLKGEELRRKRQDIQMVFQDPMSSLDPRQSVESLLVEGMRAHGLDTDGPAAKKRLRELLAAVGLPAAALAKYPHEFSGGQRQRIGIARALSVDPKLIVADEPVSALDVSVQAQVINLLEELQEEFGLTYLVVAHDLAVVRHISDRIGVMYLGGLVEEADRRRPLRPAAAPLHPGAALRRARAGPGRRGPPRADPAHRRPALAVEPADRVPLPHPLPVAPGDPVRRRAAAAARPRHPGVPAGHRVACHWAEQIESGELTPARGRSRSWWPRTTTACRGRPSWARPRSPRCSDPLARALPKSALAEVRRHGPYSAADSARVLTRPALSRPRRSSRLDEIGHAGALHVGARAWTTMGP